MTDYLVLGSGISALTFAALAARSGKRVLVVEAHEHAGGYGHTFRLGTQPRQFAFNAQLHYVWNCGPGEAVDRVLERLDLRDAVRFGRLDPAGFDRMRMPGYALDIPNDWDLLGDRLAALFPAGAGACRSFLAEVRALEEELGRVGEAKGTLGLLSRLHGLRRVWRYRKATLHDAFEAHGVPLEARTLLALQWPDFMLPPRQLSFFAFTLLFAGYMRGAYYPERHFEHVIDALVGSLRAHGGELRLQHRVVAFLTEGGRVVGAEVEEVDADGAPTGLRHLLRGREVICNMDPRAAAGLLGIERFPGRVRRKLDYRYSVSSFMAYCAVEGLDLREHGFGRSNLFHAEQVDLDRTFEDMVVRGDYRRPSFAMCVPTLLTEQRGDAPDGVQLVELLTAADHKRFLHLKLSGNKGYVRKKKEIFEAILDIVERDYVPGFRDHLVFKSLGSPTTSERYALAPQGHSYGSEMTPANMGPNRLGFDSGVDGLWFCSASAGFAGFAGTFWTGERLWRHLVGGG